jgi:GNAT superfamily N-acetyltransferase
MDLRFTPVELSEIRDEVIDHLASLPAAIDSYLEDHILASNHYRIVIGSENAGFASIHEGKLITQFALIDAYKRYGQSLFLQLRRLEEVQSAFVPTFDEFFLAHAIDDYRQLAKQAYLFAPNPGATVPDSARSCTLRQADATDAEFIRQQTGDFFDPLEKHLGAGEIFLTLRGEETVGFGIAVKSALFDDVASVGMYTIEQFRGSGVGSATISSLVQSCRDQGIRPIAGCWYYNHFSKKTLERAGMFSGSRLLKIDY